MRRYGTLLAIDETHTISCGPGGYTKAHGLEPDLFVLGKPVGGGFPCAVYGFSAEFAARAEQAKRSAPPGHSGIGTTLTANMLAMSAIRATLAEVMTDSAYAHMFALAERIESGLRDAIARHGLAWCVTRVGARNEFQFMPTQPRNGSEAGRRLDPEPWRVDHTVSQHDSGLPGDVDRRRGQAGRRVRRLSWRTDLTSHRFFCTLFQRVLHRAL
jgi:glutamate-1-semialdehyde 2,1-aminomutase